MLANKINVKDLIVKYLFAISIISLVVTIFTQNFGAMLLSIVMIVFCVVYLLVSKKEKKFFEEIQNLF